MKRTSLFCDLALAAAATVVACGFTAACHNSSHPDDKAAVYSALDKNDLANVMVDEDQGKGVITLHGIVGSPDRKTHAQQLAQQAAPGYTIQNNLQVQNIGLVNSPSTPANGPNPASNDTPGAVVKSKPAAPPKK